MFDDDFEKSEYYYHSGFTVLKLSDIRSLKLPQSHTLLMIMKNVLRGTITLSIEDILGTPRPGVPFYILCSRYIEPSINELKGIGCKLYYQKIGRDTFLFSWEES